MLIYIYLRMFIMSFSHGWLSKLTKFHTFHQESSTNGLNYYFTVHQRKIVYFAITSLLLAVASILGTVALSRGIIFVFRLDQTITRNFLLWSIVILFLFLLILPIFSLIYFILTIGRALRMRRLKKFSLTLEEGKVSICQEPLQIPENLTVHITSKLSRFSRYSLSTSLDFIPYELSPFHQLSRVQKYFTYHEKRELAEQLSSNLKIELVDTLSSFGKKYTKI